MSEDKQRHVIDLDKERTLSLWQMLQLILICCALGAGLTIVNGLLGFVLIGAAIIVLALPLLLKAVGSRTDE